MAARRPAAAAAALAAAAVAAALAGCPAGGRPDRRGDAGDGLSVAVYVGVERAPAAGGRAAARPAADAAPRRRSLALIDDRRTVEVEGGVVRLRDVAAAIDLSSLIVEPLDGRPFAIARCARELDLGGTPSVPVSLVTEDGVAVTGVLRGRVDLGGDAAWVLEDEAGAAHFVRGEVAEATVAQVGAAEIRCEVDAAPGRRRVRIAYATRDLAWTASYRLELELAGDGTVGGTIQPTFTIAGSAVIGGRRAAVSLLIGLPGGEAAPRLAWSGAVELGPGDVAVQPAPTVLAGRLEHLYRPAVRYPDDNPRLAYWRGQFTPDVWAAVWIDADPALAAMPGGPALVTASRAGAPRHARIAWPEPASELGELGELAGSGAGADGDPAGAGDAPGFHVPLWPSADLIGFRERRTLVDDGRRIVEQLLISVANHGDAAAVVWVEEELRPATRRELRTLFPRPAQRDDLLRFRVEVAPRGIERIGFEADYRW